MDKQIIFLRELIASCDIIVTDSGTWISMCDVCKKLGIELAEALNMLDKDEYEIAGLPITDNEQSGLARMLPFVNTNGLFALILISNSPLVKQFKRWLAHEVVPAILNYNIYTDEDTLNSMIDDHAVANQILRRFKDNKHLCDVNTDVLMCKII